MVEVNANCDTPSTLTQRCGLAARIMSCDTCIWMYVAGSDLPSSSSQGLGSVRTRKSRSDVCLKGDHGQCLGCY